MPPKPQARFSVAIAVERGGRRQCPPEEAEAMEELMRPRTTAQRGAAAMKKREEAVEGPEMF